MAAITQNDRMISEAEIKFGLNLFIVKIVADDTATVVELKECLSKIDGVLIADDEEELLQCNRDMMRRFRHLILSPATGLVAVDEETMRKNPKIEKYRSLYAIAMCLTNEICKEKFGQSLFEGAKVGVEYAVDEYRDHYHRNGVVD